MGLLITLIHWSVELYIYLIIAQVAVHWLIAFNVMNTQNPQARHILRFMHKATEPAYRPLRRFIPPIGGFDLTPIILIIGLSIARSVLITALYSI